MDAGDGGNDRLRRLSLVGLAVGLLALSVSNVVVSDAEPWLRLVESGLPIGLSLVFLAFAVFLYERREHPESMVVITAWALAGGVATGALAVWLHAVVTLQGISIDDPIYVVASASTVGATFGGAAGYYHARLRVTTAELRRQNVRLDEFASIVSHDLRNPLSVASGGLDLARETGDPADFERVQAAHTRMDRLIGELLDLAREGADLSDLERVSLADAAESAHATVAATHDLEVVDDVRIRADRQRLVALLENLLRNAAEHGAEGDETVTVTVGPLDDGGFYVADDGVGIPPEERDQVLEHGYTTVDSGTGIGLAIVRRIADAHGWRVSVGESESGGARFEFRA